MAIMDGNLYSYLIGGDHSPDSPLCFSSSDFVLRYGELDRTTASIASALLSTGAKPGDRILAQVHKSPLAMLTYLAAVRAGLVFVPLNTAYQLTELDYFIGDSQPALIICDPESEKGVSALASAGGIPLLTLDSTGRGSLATASNAVDGDFHTLHRAADDLACILYTSGTTGRSKGAMITHGNLIANSEMLIDAWGITDKDRLVHALPIYHVHGLFVALHTVLRAGASLTWFDRFDPQTVVTALAESTLFMGVPTYYTRLLADPGLNRNSVRNMRLFISGSAPLLPSTFAEFEQRTGHRILERYGMTETGMNTSNPLDGERRPGTVGLPLSGVEIRARNDRGEIAGTDEPGILEIRGPNIFTGYWQMPDRTRAEFQSDGYFITGDIGSISEDGYITITGRAKDLIITGGLNVYPREVEEVLDSLNGVLESAVFGAPHPDFGEGVLAAVVAGRNADLKPEILLSAVRNRLAAFKTPKRIFLVDRLPRNAMGKVQKSRLREAYSDTFGGE